MDKIEDFEPTTVLMYEEEEKPEAELLEKRDFKGIDEYMYSTNFQGRLSIHEIKKLPLDLKVCYMIQPWEKDIVPGDINEWAKLIGWKHFVPSNYSVSEETYADWIENAKKEAQRMLAFVSQFIITPISMRDFEKMNDLDKNETEYIQAIHRRGLFK